ncbi:MAG: T9SS type A sorting domain-containing protein [Rhodothermaceae bacterium]|nr:T9SS type A sorting domain-containing protein [Rhodothermaceae bacterium]
MAIPGSQAQHYTAGTALDSPTPLAGGNFGRSVGGGRDFTGDGIPDVLIGADYEAGGAGHVHLYSGADYTLVRTFSSPNPEPGTSIPGRFGHSVQAVTDYNADGVPDLLVGARSEDANGVIDAGRAYLISGADGAPLQTYTATAPQTSALFGFSVLGLSDITGDTIPDIAVGTLEEQVGGQASAGRAYLFSGADGSLIRALESPSPVFLGVFSASMAEIGDVDADGIADQAVGETVANGSRPGRVYVFSGADGALIRTIVSPNPNPSGFADGFGNVASADGDLTGDGVPDLFVGAPTENVPPFVLTGRMYLISGADGTAALTVSSPNPISSGWFGSPVARLGDTDGDGVTDVLASASQEPYQGISRAGRVYLFSGADGALLDAFGSPNPAVAGQMFPIAALGDVNHDAFPDFVAGAVVEPFAGFAAAGRAYVFTSVVANAGPDRTAECTGPSGTTVLLDGSASSDPDEGLTYTWTDPDGLVVATGISPTLTLPLGTHTFTLTVTAPNGASDSDQVQVVIQDTTPPVLTLAQERISLWPPRHSYTRYHATDFDLSVTDACAGDLTEAAILSLVWSDEPEDIPGGSDGRTTDDIVLAGDCGSVQVRAERQSRGNGRVYTLVFSATDASGNTGTVAASVEVRKRPNQPAIDDGADAGYTVACGAAAREGPMLHLGPVDAEATAYPNPFRTATTIRYELAEAGPVDVRVYDAMGRMVALLASARQEAGTHTVRFEGEPFASGVYFARLTSGTQTQLLRLTLLK